MTDDSSVLDADHPLKPVVQAWLDTLRRAREEKREDFDDFADQLMDFYTGDAEAIWGTHMWGKERKGKEPKSIPEVKFPMCLAKVAEGVQIFGPTIYHRNPQRTVTPRKFAEVPHDLIVDPRIGQQLQQIQQTFQQNPQLQQNAAAVAKFQGMQQALQEAENAYQEMVLEQQMVEMRATARAKLMSTYLNYTPNETDLKTTGQLVADEALITGAGVAFTELYRPNPASHAIVGTFYESIKRLYLDPDPNQRGDCMWGARLCFDPVWKVAKEYGVKEDYLREHGRVLTQDNKTGQNNQTTDEDDEFDERMGKSNDLIAYYKIYSKMGMGHRLAGQSAKYGDLMDSFGDNCYLVIAQGIPFPLNLTSKQFRAAMRSEKKRDDAFAKVQWPIPFWLDGGWPFTILSFHEIPNSIWPMSHFRPALPELKFGNWGYSFIADKVQQSGRTILATKKALDEEKKREIENGPAFTFLDMSEADGVLKDAIQKIDFASNQKDVWEAMQANNLNIDKRTGLSEAMYATPGGMRSATEAQVKQQAANVRPDDMANKMEDWSSAIARKEGMAAAWMLEEDDVAPVLGPAGAKLWIKLFADADPQEIAFELDYRVEAGSAKKPNKDTKIYQASELLRIVGPVYAPLVQMGNAGPWNAVVKTWCEANDVENVEDFLVPPPDPQQQQMAQQQQEQQMQLEQAKIQADIQGKQMDAQLKQLDAQIKQAEGQAKLELEKQKMALEREKAMMEMQIEQQKAQLEIGLAREKGQQELQQDQQVHQQEMVQAQQQSQMNLATAAEMNRQKVSQSEEIGNQKIAMAKKQAAAKPQSESKPKKKGTK
jgi:hypothetical protein